MQSQSKNLLESFVAWCSLDYFRLLYISLLLPFSLLYPQFSFLSFLFHTESTVFFPENILSVEEDVGELFIPVHRSGDISEELMVVCYTQQGMEQPFSAHWHIEWHCTWYNYSTKGNKGERAEVCQMTQELDWKSVATGLMEGWILPRARTSTLLKQCGIILETSLKKPVPEDYLKKLQESLSKRVHDMLKDKRSYQIWTFMLRLHRFILTSMHPATV